MSKTGKFLLCYGLPLLLMACSTTTLPDTIENIHFPRFASRADREVLPVYLKGRLKLKENCIVVEATNSPLKGFHRVVMLIWDFDTILSLDKGKIKISHPSHPERRPLVVGSKVNLSGKGNGESYDPSLYELRKTPPPTCQPTSNSFVVASW